MFFHVSSDFTLHPSSPIPYIGGPAGSDTQVPYVFAFLHPGPCGLRMKPATYKTSESSPHCM